MKKHQNMEKNTKPASATEGAEMPVVDTGVESQPAEAGAQSSQTAATVEDENALREKAAKAQQYYEQWVRTMADFDNYKKRAARERNDAIRFANESLLQKLVPILDNFDMAMMAAGQTTTVQAIQTGVAMIHQQLKAALNEAGLEEIDATSKPFDPNVHEAVGHEVAAGTPEGSVLRQLRKGYKLRERLIRPATVVVAKGADKA